MLPTWTFTKLTLAGFAESCPAVIPAPVRDSERELSEASLANEMVAELADAAEGVKATLRFALWPAAIIKGTDGAVTENWGELDLALLTVREAFPLFVAVIVWVAIFPRTTLPKVMDDLLRPRSPDAGGV